MPKPDWKKLTLHTGPATRVPTLIKELSGEDALTASLAFSALRVALVRPGEWLSSSAPAVTALLGSLKKAARQEEILVLVADVVGADHVRGWVSDTTPAVRGEAAAAAVTGRSALLEAASAERPIVRSAALLVLAMLRELADEVEPVVRRMAKDDGDEGVRASALLALGALAPRGPETLALLTRTAQEGESSLLRGASTMARLRAEGKVSSLDAVAAGLEAWLAWSSSRPDAGQARIAWFGGLDSMYYEHNQFLAPAAHSLVALARERQETAALEELLLRWGSEGKIGRVAASAGDALVELSGLSQYWPRNKPHAFVALTTELTADQIAFAKKLTATTLLPGAGFGLAAGGACRKRWLGLLPPGPLDRMATLVIAGKSVTVPLWRAWVDLEQSGVRAAPVPPPLDKELSGLDRWQALIDMLSNTFGGRPPLIKEEEVLGDVPAGDELFDRATQVADDLALRFEAAAREARPLWLHYAVTALVLLPLVRAGRPVRPEWDVLVYVGSFDGAREVMAALPAERREARLWDFVKDRGVAEHRGLGEAIAMLDLAPSRRIADNLAGRLHNDAVAKAYTSVNLLARLQELQGRLEALAENEPAVREALSAAR
jgi:hypothetical protein